MLPSPRRCARLLQLLHGVVLVWTAGTAWAQVGTNLPIVVLDAKDPIVADPKVPCRVQLLLPPGGDAGHETNSGLVCIHGGVSKAYAKKSYRFTLEHPMEWLGLSKSAHWVLNAACIDRSLMRHKLSYDLFLSLSATNARRFAAQSRFVELLLNGQYNGVYLIMERVDRALLELRRFDSNATQQACIYKAVDHAANFSQAGHAGYEQREPDPLIKPYWGPLNEFNRFVSHATDAEFFDSRTGIVSRLDLDNAIDFQLLVLLTSNSDGITKNFILARDAPTREVPAPHFFFTPWDYDATFGRNWDASPVEPKAWLSNHLFDRLHGDAGFRKKLAARWRQLRAGPFSVASLHRNIEDNARTLGDAARRNATRWRSLRGIYPDPLTYEEDLAQMKQWVEQRTAWLDAEIQRREQ